MSTPAAAVKAFQIAQSLAKESAVLQLVNAPLDIHDDDPENEYRDCQLEKNLEQVRAALIDEYISSGGKDSGDVTGERFADQLTEAQASEYWGQCTNRQEAGYIYGLAVGLALAGKGGAR